MSTDFEREVGAVLHSAADPLPPPPLDLASIRRAGRHRKAWSMALATLATVVVAGGAVTGGLRLAAVPQATRPGSSSQPSGMGSRMPTSGTTPSTAALANVRAFYSGYETARKQGQAAVDTLIRAHVAPWYIPILEAPARGGSGPIECGHAGGAAALDYRAYHEAGGQSIIVVGSQRASSVNPGLSVVIADSVTGKITGIACAFTGNNVSRAGAETAAKALYLTYLPLRRRGTPVQGALERLLASGPATGSWYLWQAHYAAARRLLTYDPVLCTPAGIPSVSVSTATTIIGGSAGVVMVVPRHGRPILTVVVLGAKGWTVDDIACPNA